MPTETRLGVDKEAADLVHEARRDMSAFEQADLTLSDAIKRLVAWWRGQPVPGHVDGGQAGGRVGLFPAERKD